MRRALIVAYHYPPEPASGALRMSYLARYLPEFGWKPVVLTRNAPGAASNDDVIRVGKPFAAYASGRSRSSSNNRALAQLKSAVKSVIFFPDSAASWIPTAFAAAVREHRKDPFDAIITSAMPASVHLVGCLLSLYLRVPWIADYRDLWDGNPYVSDPRWRKMLLRQLERRALRRAATITTISEGLAAPLGALHTCGVRVIPNAADAGEWSGIEFVRPDVFRIVHCGSLYDGKRSPRRLLAQIAQMRRGGNEAARALKIDFYGPEPGNLIEMVHEYGLQFDVAYHGVVDRQSAMRAERSAALLLVIQNDDPRTASEYGSKIFEYEAAGKPIFALGPQDSVLRTYIRDKRLGWFACSDAEICAAISDAHRVYESGASVDRANGVWRSARSIAEDFVGVLPV